MWKWREAKHQRRAWVHEGPEVDLALKVILRDTQAEVELVGADEPISELRVTVDGGRQGVGSDRALWVATERALQLPCAAIEQHHQLPT